ncbi:MAG: hypothetical protein K8F59_16150 [Rhodobacteraceae bacterium]|nr:hypothetical protein [Paracoccaceae bacterium]
MLSRPLAPHLWRVYLWRMFNRLPKLVRFLALHMFWGFTFGSVFVFGVIWFDVLGVGAMLAKDTTGIATFLLFFQSMLTFGGVAMGVAVMNLREDE